MFHRRRAARGFAISTGRAYLAGMRRTFEFCIPVAGKAVPASVDWIHEVEYDRYRVRLERDGDDVRLITRGGYNWPDR
jgi:hypothetical protein